MNRSIFLIVFLLVSQSLVAVELDAKLGWAGHKRYGFVVNGVVEEILFGEGSRVMPGDVLAKLDVQPFNYKLKRCHASVKKLEPLIFDAKLELGQAEDLFERTVLSEVELQKIDGKYKALVAEQDMAKAKLQLAKWKAGRAILKSDSKAYVLGSSLVPGLIISDENKSDVYIELVAADKASATTWLSEELKTQLKSKDKIKVIVDERSIQAEIYSIAMRPDKNRQYKMIAVFDYHSVIVPDKVVKVSF